jgi:tetratricopeptide (TPR) repeat protein
MTKKYFALLLLVMTAAGFAQDFVPGPKDDPEILRFTGAIRINPNDAESYNNRGVAYAGKRDYDLAIADYTQAISLNPDYAEAYNNRGDAWFNKGDVDKAIADYTQSLRLNPRFTGVPNDRLTIYKDKAD